MSKSNWVKEEGKRGMALGVIVPRRSQVDLERPRERKKSAHCRTKKSIKPGETWDSTHRPASIEKKKHPNHRLKQVAMSRTGSNRGVWWGGVRKEGKCRVKNSQLREAMSFSLKKNSGDVWGAYCHRMAGSKRFAATRVQLRGGRRGQKRE